MITVKWLVKSSQNLDTQNSREHVWHMYFRNEMNYSCISQMINDNELGDNDEQQQQVLDILDDNNHGQ